MKNTIAKRVIDRVNVKESSRARAHERKYPITSYTKKISRFKL